MTKKLRKPLSILLSIIMVLSVFTIIPVTSASAARYVCPYCKSGDIEDWGDEWICNDCGWLIDSPLDLDAEYTITWKNSDGTTLAADRLKYNEMPSYTHEGFTLNEDEYFTYVFTGWYPTLSPANGDTTYYAQYNRIAKQGVPEEQSVTFDITPSKTIFEQGDIKITLVWDSGDNGFMIADFSALANVSAGSKGIITKMVMTRGYSDGSYGGTPITLANGKTIMSTRSGEVFTCDNIVANTAGIRAYGSAYAYIKEITVYYLPLPTYTVTWKNYDGFVLETDADVAEGATPEYNGTVPTKADDDQYTYEFAGWNDGTTTYALNEALPQVNSDMTFTAVFDSTDKQVAAVVALINAIPTEVTVDDKDDIEAARAAYAALTDAQKDLVEADVLTKLEAAEESLAAAEQAAADAVAAMINNLPNPENVTVDDKDAIETTGYALAALTNAQRALINPAVIVRYRAIAEAFAAVDQAAADQAAAQGVTYLINQIPAEVTENDKETVEKARKAYNMLTDAQKELLAPETLAKLEAAEKALIPELVNESYIENDVSEMKIGNSITVICDSTGGAGTKQYEVWYKRSTATKWTKAQSLSDNTSVSITPKHTGEYTVSVKVKDEAGTAVKKRMSFTVTTDLENTSEISASAILKGDSITVTCASTGGVGTKQYEVWYKRSTATKWTKAQSLSANTSVSITPKHIGEYTISVKVKDEAGIAIKKYIPLTVTTDLENTSEISVSAISKGDSITATCASTGGVGTKQYEVWYKHSTATKWTRVQRFSTNTSVVITPKHTGEYTVSVKVKDEVGTAIKKRMPLTVS